MSKDQAYGLVIFAISLLVAIVFLVMFFAPYIGLPGGYGLQFLALAIPVVLFVLLVLVIGGWIGWTMLTTPPPAPLDTGPPSSPPTEPQPESKT